ncbi:ABC transporter ATP-binding protein [Paenibacillus sp. GCM10023250]|uniref:ABC transporter ATP-binding protein n=1 Tax=Paenibacillus sp. GCM10023250 TaxID=3252648 RepID=UPI0036068545
MSDLAAPSPSVVDVRGVSRRFGGRTVLDGVSLQVGAGELFGLLGPSGSGKTTLIKLMTGIDRADGGTVHLLGERMPKLAMLKRLGYMAQSDALYGELTAKENLAFFGSLYGLKGERLAKRIRAAMALVDLEAHLNKAVSAYSGGMKRRLSLAIALLHEPELLVLDEPTVGIDPVLRRSIWRELGDMRRSGTTIVLTTHVMDEAELCGRLGLIRDGRLTAVGTPEDLMRQCSASSIEDAFIALGGGARA